MHLQAECIGVLAAQLEDVTDLDTARDLHRALALRTRVTGANLRNVDGAVRLEISTVHQVINVTTGLIRAGDPRRPPSDARIEQILHSRRPCRPEGARADVALDQRRVRREVVLFEGTDLRRVYRRFESALVDLAVSGHADRQRSLTAIGVHPHHQDVLKCVRREPGITVAARELGAGVGHFDEGVDGRRIGSVLHMRGADGDRLFHRYWNRDGFHVRRETALRAAHERVLTDRCRREKLLAR